MIRFQGGSARDSSWNRCRYSRRPGGSRATAHDAHSLWCRFPVLERRRFAPTLLAAVAFAVAAFGIRVASQFCARRLSALEPCTFRHVAVLIAEHQFRGNRLPPSPAFPLERFEEALFMGRARSRISCHFGNHRHCSAPSGFAEAVLWHPSGAFAPHRMASIFVVEVLRPPSFFRGPVSARFRPEGAKPCRALFRLRA